MAKKQTRRAPKSSSPRLYGGTPPAPGGKPAAQSGQLAATTSPAARPSAASARTVSSVVRPNLPLSVEYKYVAGDLKRLGITAVSFFAVLIAVGVVAYFLQR